jgi:division protein CdvB (Snf7/Vps24/ESCRT-III family)
LSTISIIEVSASLLSALSPSGVPLDATGTKSQMSGFSSKWQKQDEAGFASKIRDSIKTPPPLRLRIEQASRQISVQITKLEGNSARLREKESTLFNKVVSSLQKHEKEHANMLANELAEIRKMDKMVTSAKLALEQISLRLNTIQDLGDITAMLSPTMGIIKGVRSQLTGLVPEAQSEIGEISDLLSAILSDVGQMNSAPINFETANEEADKVLAEAAAVAEQTMRQRFPDLPITEDMTDESELA